MVSGHLHSYVNDNRIRERISTVQLLVDVQELCANWNNEQESGLERFMSYDQGFVELTLEDLELLDDYAVCEMIVK